MLIVVSNRTTINEVQDLPTHLNDEGCRCRICPPLLSKSGTSIVPGSIVNAENLRSVGSLCKEHSEE